MENVSPPTTQIKSKKKPIKKWIFIGSIIFVVLAVVGVITGLVLLREPQDIREEAAVSTGTAKIYITPETKTINAGETFTASVLFDTSNIAISGLTVKLEYQFIGSSPPISATNIVVNPSLVLENAWDFPYKNISTGQEKVVIEIAGLSTSVAGYTTAGQENLATITFKGDSPGTINVSFDATESVIASKIEEIDILLIPQSTGTYTVAGEIPSTPSPTSTPSPNITPTPVATAPPVPTSGVSTPTIITAGLGALLIIGSIILIL